MEIMYDADDRMIRDITDELFIVSNAVYNYRKQHGFTQEDMAALVGGSRSNLSKLENLDCGDISFSIVVALVHAGVLRYEQLYLDKNKGQAA